MLTTKDDNRKGKSQRKDYTVQEEVMAVMEYDELMDGLDAGWAASPVNPYDCPMLENILLGRIDHFKWQITDIYSKYFWDSEKVNEGIYSYTTMDYPDVRKLDDYWWVYRELRIIHERIYVNKEKYF